MPIADWYRPYLLQLLAPGSALAKRSTAKSPRLAKYAKRRQNQKVGFQLHSLRILGVLGVSSRLGGN
jgi:hypothetical protein